jgi:hypothetical protein
VVEIRHPFCSPYHLQTHDKREQINKALKAWLDRPVFTSPKALRTTRVEFIEIDNYHRHHKAIGNATLADVYLSRREEIVKGRKEPKHETLDRRRQTKPEGFGH